MFITTNEFKEKMNGVLRPAIDAKVEYGQVDVKARDTAEVNSTSAACVYSRANQTLNDRRIEENVMIGTLEQKEFLLDGNFILSPNQTLAENYEVGYRPLEVGSADGSMNVVLQIKTQENINATGLSITFSKLLDQYATDFTISFGDKTYNITNNKKVVWLSDFEVTGVNIVTITITKWCKPYTRAKITQVEFGSYITFGLEELTELNATNKLSAVSQQLSESNVNFTFLNIEKTYNPMALGGREKFIAERQPVRVYMGYPNEMLLVGYYELTGAPKVSNSTVQLSAVSLIKRFDKIIDAKYYNQASLYTIADDLMKFCGITYYTIDNSLRNITATCIIEGNCREILTDLCVASCCELWQADDTLVIGKKPNTASGFCINSDIAQAPEINIDNPIKKLSIKGTTIAQESAVSQLTTFEATTAGTYLVGLSDKALNITATNCTILSSTLDTVTITVAANQKAVISGNRLIKNNITYNHSIDGIDLGTEITVNDNPFVNDQARADAVISWLLSYYGNRQGLNSNWRQNPALEVGDVVQIDTDFGKYYMKAEENSLSLKDGGLTGSTKGRLVNI